MPWATALQPSIQLGILTARLRRAGIATAGMYANLRFAELVGLAEYEKYGTYDSFFSQWVFAETLFGRFSPPPGVGPSEFCDFAAQAGVPASQLDELVRVKACMPAFVDEFLSALDWSSVRVVGFTTTLLQTVPALAFARVLKAKHPHLRILLGGAGCHGGMGKVIHRNFEFIDGIVDGEADLVIVPLVQSILADRTPEPVPGLLWRGATPSEAHPVVPELGDYPMPAYEDYFAEARRVFGRLPSEVTRVPFEASRGCWWALKRQCKFCGLNGEALAQRPRDVEAVVDELAALHRLHGATFFFATDNIIAPTHVTHLPALIRERLPPVELFFETRVAMQRTHLQELAGAGIVHMQAGIESLIQEVLDKTDKGTTPTSNLCFLRRSVEFKVRPYWNLLFGFPGDDRSWYDGLIAVMPRFHHLPAPDAIQFSLQRFSPYFNEPERYGIHSLGPRLGSRYVWDLPADEIRDLSFDLAFDCPGSEDFAATGEALRDACRAWRMADAELSASLTDDATIVVRDTRPAFAGSHVVPPGDGLVLRALEKPQTTHQLTQRLTGHRSPGTGPAPDIAAALDWLTGRGMVHEDHGIYIALVVPRARGFWLDEREQESAQPRRSLGRNIFLPVLG
jgi:magnesium-protoporphyrin IX monomethyl ester (oxidative) cyclase